MLVPLVADDVAVTHPQNPVAQARDRRVVRDHDHRSLVLPGLAGQKREHRDDVWRGLMSVHEAVGRDLGLRAPTRAEFDRCVDESLRILHEAAASP